MNKVLIKVIKRNNKDTAKKNRVAAVVSEAKIVTDVRIETVKTVGSWISEQARKSSGRTDFFRRQDFGLGKPVRKTCLND